jgi:hypothetical protein
VAGGQLATAAKDGDIHLYAPDGTRHLRAEAPDGAEPLDVAWRPDGERVAIGYYAGEPQVDVLALPALTRAHRVETRGLPRGKLAHRNLGVVAWSADGRFPNAAGTYRTWRTTMVVRRASAGQGQRQRRALPGPDNTVMDLVALPDDGVVCGAADTTVALLRRTARSTGDTGRP